MVLRLGVLFKMLLLVKNSVLVCSTSFAANRKLCEIVEKQILEGLDRAKDKV